MIPITHPFATGARRKGAKYYLVDNDGNIVDVVSPEEFSTILDEE